jgi:uncharacterized protein YrzB (UPF0473 family)
MTEDALAFRDAERFVLEDDDGHEETFLVLAVAEYQGRDYALLAPESGAENPDPERELEVVVFEYVRGNDGPELREVESEEKQEAVFAVFQELMELEDEDDEDEDEDGDEEEDDDAEEEPKA